MTERMQALKDYQWNRQHHAARCPLPDKIEASYRNPALSDVERTALRLEAALAAETPFILRMPIIPGVNDTPEHFETAARLIAGSPALQCVELLPYQPAAGAKYEMVNMRFDAPCDAQQTPAFHTNSFDRLGIPWKRFR